MTQQEGLVALRSLVEGQKRELEKKNRVIEQQDRRIRQLDIQVENMIQALLHARKKIFGSSTEAKG